jgi:putative transposase
VKSFETASRFVMTKDSVFRTTWRHIDIHRQIRNHAVRDYYRSPRIDRPSDYKQHGRLTDWKQQWPSFADVSAHAAQQTVSQIHKDLTVLKSHRENGRNTGRLKWKGSGEFRSMAYQSEGYDVDQNTGRSGWATLTLSKIGTIPIRTHREIPNTDTIKRVILKKERTGEWFVCLVIERSDDDLPEKPPLDEIDRTDCIGIDLGILSHIKRPLGRSLTARCRVRSIRSCPTVARSERTRVE